MGLQRRRRRYAALLAGGLLLLAGCTNGRPAEGTAVGDTAPVQPADAPITVAVVSHSRAGDSFWDVVKSGAEEAGRQQGITVNYAGDGDPTQQSQLIDNAVAQGVDGLVVSMANPEGVRASVEGAVAAGIPVITINAGMVESAEYGAVTHVGQSERMAGEQAGERLRESGVTGLLCVIHEAGSVSQEERCAGAAEGFGGPVENIQVDISNTADARATIQNKLMSDDSVDGVLTLNPAIATSALGAIGDAGSDADLATFDVSADIVEAVRAGDMLFAIDQQPYAQGYLGVTLMGLKVRNGNDVGGGRPVYSGPAFITADNADQVAQYAERGTR
ncbi:substrate-binding domain-containing protein [Marinitenerispora sediminis]|uniref:Sugar ABC transporter substrate-binding protein n=1 Tax=Marinitenerispora sediminis TaxID=1931232 RepID=A0A368T1J1_9ACTN|nr:substrate-binding domain-containing protein [Marinitenerispora sediminis]RCV50943.1 sugar ABC transporter substrate-binding protein [Marinitenerispora sediminis]RCV51607.1 sugar ABC transporter substrate-binding protein [Marinitenerispora sediminis]RCV54276.1 sugar ABC transporter substrate-binding protein [Marinitenerispora sediminis]